MQGPGAIVLSILMLAAMALAIGGMWLIARKRDVRKGALMLVAAIVFIGNVLVWTWPMEIDRRRLPLANVPLRNSAD